MTEHDMPGTIVTAFTGRVVYMKSKSTKSKSNGKTRAKPIVECRNVWKIYNEGKPSEVRALQDVAHGERAEMDAEARGRAPR